MINETWHLLKKDLRRLWPFLSAIYALVLVQSLLALRDPLTEDTFLPLGPLEKPFYLLVVSVVGMAVQQESLVGTTAFWLTRPIRRGALVAAKATFLAAFVVAPPILAMMAVWASFGLEAERYLVLLFESLGPFVYMVILGVVLAAVTPSLPAYFATWVAGLLAFGLTTHLMQWLFHGTLFSPGRLLADESSRRVVFWAVVVIPGALLALHRYLTRKTRRSFVGLGVGFLVVASVEALWSWDVLHALGDAAPTTPQLALSSSTTDGVFLAEREPGDGMTIRGHITASGAPGLDFRIRKMWGELAPRQGQTAFVMGHISGDWERAVEEALPGYRWVGDRPPAHRSITVRTLGRPPFDKLIGQTATLTLTARGQAYRYRLAGTIPLTLGARFEQGANAAVIRRISRGEDELRVRVRERYVSSWLDPRLIPGTLLVNPARREMLLARRPEGYRRFSRFLTSQIVGYPKTLPFPLEVPSGDDVIRIGDDWLAGAELAFLESVPAGRFETTLRVDDFRMHDATFARETVYAIE